jgi:hypothetical protein
MSCGTNGVQRGWRGARQCNCPTSVGAMPMAGALTREVILAEHQRTQAERVRAGTALGIRPDSPWPAGLGGEVIEQFVGVKQETTALEAPTIGKRMILPGRVVTNIVVDVRPIASTLIGSKRWYLARTASNSVYRVYA